MHGQTYLESEGERELTGDDVKNLYRWIKTQTFSAEKRWIDGNTSAETILTTPDDANCIYSKSRLKKIDETKQNQNKFDFVQNQK